MLFVLEVIKIASLLQRPPDKANFILILSVLSVVTEILSSKEIFDEKPYHEVWY